jgi:tetratricopeptide (TPR) repeat protein
LIVAGVVIAAVSAGAVGAVALRRMSFAQQTKEEFKRLVERQEDAQVLAGVLVENVPLLSTANRVGLRGGDIITNYDGERITDDRTFRASLDRFAAGPPRSINLTVMRAGAPVELTAPSGSLGFKGKDWAWVPNRIFELVGKDRVDDAVEMLSTIDPAMVSEAGYLKSQIVILDDNDALDEQRNQLISRLMPLVSKEDPACLGCEFKGAGRNKAAAVFLAKAVEANPADISSRENLAAAYTQMRHYDEAGRVIDDIVAHHSSEMSDWGWHVLLRQRGEVYLSRHNQAAAAADFRKSLELDTNANNDDTGLLLQYLFALATLKDLDNFEKGVALCNRHATEKYSARAYDRDGLRAYILLANGNEAAARAAVQKWRNDKEAKRHFESYWGEFPDASDVMDAWIRLTR